MANILSQLGGNLTDMLWGSLGSILTVVIVVVGMVMIFTGIGLFLWWKGYGYPVHIYTPMGQVDTKVVESVKDMLAEQNIKQAYDTVKENRIQFDRLKHTKTHGKYTTIKGVQYFLTFRPMRKLPPVPLWLLYNDGIHVLQLSKNILVPIKQPKVITEVEEEVILKLEDHSQWETWNNMMTDRINNKFQDLDVQKKVIFFFISGIIVLTLLGGFIIWLVYKSATKGYENANILSESITRLTSGGAPK